jgi:hypothetical protein
MVKEPFCPVFSVFLLRPEFLSLVEHLLLRCPERVDGNGMPALKRAGPGGWLTYRKMNG